MSDGRKRLGALGEEIACEHLTGLGHTILHRNWKGGHLEVDIISLDRNGVHFVEVKSRTAPTSADPEENVDLNKQRRLVRASRLFLRSAAGRCLPRGAEINFDVVSIVFDGEKVNIEYIPQAFIPIFV